MKKVLVIVGPTGSGKSQLSIEIAKALKAEIMNADSVQLYKEYNIGSAKLTPSEQQGITHHLLSHVEPDASYDVAQFQKEGRECLESISMPIVCGGTGLYIKALLYKYEFSPLTFVEDNLSIPEKISYILTHDPHITLDTKNSRRVESAYQLIKNGNMRSSLNEKNIPLYDVFTIYLDIDRDVLKSRLIDRLERQLNDGFIDEVKMLKHQYGVKPFIGYKEIDQFLEGEYSFETMKETIILKSMKFAKKQKTWFKNQMDINIYDALDIELTQKVIKDVTQWLNT